MTRPFPWTVTLRNGTNALIVGHNPTCPTYIYIGCLHDGGVFGWDAQGCAVEPGHPSRRDIVSGLHDYSDTGRGSDADWRSRAIAMGAACD